MVARKDVRKDVLKKIEEKTNELENLLKQWIPLNKKIKHCETEINKNNLSTNERAFYLQLKREMEERCKEIKEKVSKLEKELTVYAKNFLSLHWPWAINYLVARLKDVENQWRGWGYRPLALDVLEGQYVLRHTVTNKCRSCRDYWYSSFYSPRCPYNCKRWPRVNPRPGEDPKRIKEQQKQGYLRCFERHLRYKNGRVVDLYTCSRVPNPKDARLRDVLGVSELREALSILAEETERQYHSADLTWILSDLSDKPVRITLTPSFGNEEIRGWEYGDS